MFTVDKGSEKPIKNPLKSLLGNVRFLRETHSFQVGEAKKRLSYLTSAPFNPLESEDQDGDEEGQEALRKGNRSRELV